MKASVVPALMLALAGCRPSGEVATQSASDAFVAVYRWRVRPGCEERFRAAWQSETLAFRNTWGSYGTLLTRSDDGSWVALAFWPSRSRWEEAHRLPLPLPGPEATLAECILAKEEEFHLKVTDDLTRLPGH